MQAATCCPKGNLHHTARFAKVDLLTGKPCFPWCPWRPGGEFLDVPCLATLDRRVLVLKGMMGTADFTPSTRASRVEQQDGIGREVV